MFLNKNESYLGYRYYNSVFYIIGITSLIFILQILTRENYGLFFMSPITAAMALNPVAVVKYFQFWRIFTYMFIHGGFFHIFLKMRGLYLFGTILEQRIGTFRFLLIYFLSGIIGGLLWVFVYFNSNIYCIGASGALFGIMVASAMMFPNATIMLLFPPIPLKLKTFVIVYAVIETLFSIGGSTGGVAHIVHLGGLVTGYIIMRYMYPRESYDIFYFIKKYLNINKSKSNFGGRITPKWSFNSRNSVTLDEILNKISREGINSLSEKEMEILRKAREEMKRRN